MCCVGNTVIWRQLSCCMISGHGDTYSEQGGEGARTLESWYSITFAPLSPAAFSVCIPAEAELLCKRLLCGSLLAGHRISKDGETKIQVQLVYHSGSFDKFQFCGSDPVGDRAKVSKLLQQYTSRVNKEVTTFVHVPPTQVFFVLFLVFCNRGNIHTCTLKTWLVSATKPQES